MNRLKNKQKIEFGDYQTPLELAIIVTHKLLSLDIKPEVIIEPTCGIGNFLLAAKNDFESAEKLIGVETNPTYVEQIYANKGLNRDSRITIVEGNFFDFTWKNAFDVSSQKVLVLGNFPWVTNSMQGVIKGKNLPRKNNFQNHRGLDSITGKSNFDISEWMSIKTIDWLQQHDSYLAMLCKTSVARKVINYIQSKNYKISYCATYKIDALKHFKANVQSCLLYCDFTGFKKQYFCDVFADFHESEPERIGYYNKTLVKNIEVFDRVKSLFTHKSHIKWRSGIKHDCSKVMELSRNGTNLINGFNETVDIEDTYLYPLLKGSAVANGKIDNTQKYVIVTQKKIGDKTDDIALNAPKTWSYLSRYCEYLDSRKSKIYRDKPRFSVFGVGEYSFKPWKIAICGLYKKLEFKLVHKINERPAFFDDTVYFISFDDEQKAKEYYALLTSKKIFVFYSSLIFWDEKRPIKAGILNKLDLEKAMNEFTNLTK